MAIIMLTPKQIKFAQSIVSGMSQADAYRTAYPNKMSDKTIVEAASRQMADSNVLAMIEKLRAPVIKRAQITLENHLNDLQSLRNMATEEKQYSAAISAEVARGKASGLYIEKIDATVGPIKIIASWETKPGAGS